MDRKTNVDAELDQLRNDLSTLRKDINSLTSAMKSAGIRRSRRISDGAREAGEYVRREARSRREQMGEYRHRAGPYVEERPVTTMLTAFSVGFVTSLLLDRTRNRDQ